MSECDATDTSQIKIPKEDFYKVFTKEQYRDYVIETEAKLNRMKYLLTEGISLMRVVRPFTKAGGRMERWMDMASNFIK